MSDKIMDLINQLTEETLKRDLPKHILKDYDEEAAKWFEETYVRQEGWYDREAIQKVDELSWNELLNLQYPNRKRGRLLS